MSWDSQPPDKDLLVSPNVSWDAEPPDKDLLEPISELESGARGVAQGLSMGLSDEAVGGVEALWEKAKGNPEEFGKLYALSRDESRANNAKAKEANPGSYLTGEIGGGVASAFVPGMNIAKGASLGKIAAQSALQGGLMGFGNSEAEGMDLAKDTALGTTMGGVGGAALAKGAQLASPLIKQGMNKFGQKLASGAEDLAVNATGATGVQSAKFADDAGRQLLDRKLVRPFDNAERVASRVSAEMDRASGSIDEALKGLDAKGVTANVDDIAAKLEAKAASLDSDPSQAGIAKKLRSIIDDIYQSGQSQVPLSAAEQTKRGFRKTAGNWMDPEVGQAGKQAYLGYMDEVESAAGIEPVLQKMFKEGKETFGLLAPIQEAAERRAMQQRQSPWGGLGDMVAGGTGGIAGGPVGALGTVAAKKLVFPRMTSTAAVGMDEFSKALMKSPQMEKFFHANPAAFTSLSNRLQQSVPKAKPKIAEESKAPDREALLKKTQGSKYGQVLQNAAQKSDQSFAAAHYVLSQRDPDYRQVLEGEENGLDQEYFPTA